MSFPMTASLFNGYFSYGNGFENWFECWGLCKLSVLYINVAKIFIFKQILKLHFLGKLSRSCTEKDFQIIHVLMIAQM